MTGFSSGRFSSTRGKPASCCFCVSAARPPSVPAGATRGNHSRAGTARSSPGRAAFWRGEANPWLRAPFWRPSTSRRAAKREHVPAGEPGVGLVLDRRADDSQEHTRRLITLIIAGRNRIVMIRRLFGRFSDTDKAATSARGRGCWPAHRPIRRHCGFGRRAGRSKPAHPSSVAESASLVPTLKSVATVSN